MSRTYTKYLIENLTYSFEEDDASADNEKFVFNRRKISDAIDILSNIGPVGQEIICDEDYENSYYNGDEKKLVGPMVIVMQQYKRWEFDNKFKIEKIYYVLLSDNREFLEFNIKEFENNYSIIYNLSERKWQNFFNKDRLYKSIWDTIRHIIKLFNNKDV